MNYKRRPRYNIGTYPTQTGGYRGFAYVDPDGNIYTTGIHTINGTIWDLDAANNNYGNIQRHFLSSKDGRWRYFDQNFFQPFPQQTNVYIPQGVVDEKEHTYYLSGTDMSDTRTGYDYKGDAYTGANNFTYSPTTRRKVVLAEPISHESNNALRAFNKYVFNLLTNTW